MLQRVWRAAWVCLALGGWACGGRSDVDLADVDLPVGGDAGFASGGSTDGGVAGSTRGGTGGSTRGGNGGSTRGGTRGGNGGSTRGGAGGVNFGGAGGVTFGGRAGAGGERPFSCEDCFRDAGPCEDVACDALNEQCYSKPLPDGWLCDDGDYCTVSEQCQQGVCRGGKANSCGLKPSTCQAVTCDSQANACSLVTAKNGTACATSDKCEVDASCQFGKCEGAPKDCSGIMLPNACYAPECDADTGACKATPLTGSSCDDGDPCTTGDSCKKGTCAPGSAVQACTGGDKCCPKGCSNSTDSDCPGAKIVLDAVNRGWWSQEGTHQPWNNNTLTGYCGNCSPAGNYWSYFSFDLSGVSSKVVSVTLILELETFFGFDASETVKVSDVSTAASTLESATNDATVFGDLGGGKSYGSYTALPSEVGTLLEITLNAQAVADINAALGGEFSVGLSTTSLTQSDIVEALRFSSDAEARAHQLVLGMQ